MNIKLVFALLFLLFSRDITTAQLRRIEAVKGESSITYRMVHPLHKIEAVSKDAVCDIDADPATKSIQDVTVSVDVTTFSSGNSNRDSHAMEVIDALTYPDAEFKSSRITPAGDSMTVDGMLTFHGLTHDVRIAAKTEWSGHTLTVTGGFTISLTAFHVDRPALLLIPVDDTLRFDFVETFTL